MKAELQRWSQQHPFALAVVVMLVIVIPAFARAEQAINHADRAAASAQAQADATKAQATRNTAIVKCVTDWVRDETDALQDRDGVNKAARAASRDLWKSIRGLTAVPPTNSREVLLASIDRYMKILGRVDRNELVNPYPEIADCLQDVTATEPILALGFQTVGFTMAPRYDDSCFGRRITIRGTFGDDNIHGTDGPDVIFAYSGSDLIIGGKGNDYVCARFGDDTVIGGQGFDYVDCGGGDDVALQSERARYCE